MLCCVRKAEENRDIRERLARFLGSFSRRTGVAGHIANILDPDNWLPGGREAAFTLALIALSAKMAMADGAVTASEVRAFNATVEIAKGQEPQIERLFNLAQQDVAGYDAYARKVARFFADAPETLEHVLDGLFFIATADGMVHEAELDYLRSVSAIFGFDEVRFEQIAAQHVMLDESVDPYMVLGLTHDAPPEEVRRVYRLLVAEHHPDRLIAKGVPEELIDVATARMSAINLAYQAITKPKAQPLLT
ncbi:DnaJ family molecular chaperone [Devosia sp. FJ2-5-3]|jgi:DnaJ like chaperone protein|uniref:J domain-containing protein n=1 Tax=Devosia sp. FJ2-5-3 TaxID=2976680 RepID=UPI0023D89958|nr:DnaJ family molecular chaperone [Devosia sp. FJ2-5-3]WEJ59841.1 DnaJ family molecular chaperone [Devosia sp. FJ2-5-3]